MDLETDLTDILTTFFGKDHSFPFWWMRRTTYLEWDLRDFAAGKLIMNGEVEG